MYTLCIHGVLSSSYCPTRQIMPNKNPRLGRELLEVSTLGGLLGEYLEATWVLEYQLAVA